MKFQLTVYSLCSFSLLFADEPKELLSLKQSWTKAREQVTTPIDKKYVDALEAMKMRFTKSGDLTSALAVDTELRNVIAMKSVPAATATQDVATASVKTRGELEKALSDTVWTVVRAEDQKPWPQVEFKAGGKFSGFNKTDILWKVVDKETARVQDYEFKFSQDVKEFTVVWGATGKLIGTRKSQ